MVTAFTTIATTALQAALAPEAPDPPAILDTETARLGNAADQESARRRAANPQLVNSMAVGAPTTAVGQPTVVLGG